MGQAVVKDERLAATALVKPFDFVAYGELLSPLKHPETVWLKTSKDTAMEIVGEKPGAIQNAATDCEYMVRPDLRLELVLKTTET